MFNCKWNSLRPAQIVECGETNVGIVVVVHQENYDWMEKTQLKAEIHRQGFGTSLVRHFVDETRLRNRPLRLQAFHENHNTTEAIIEFSLDSPHLGQAQVSNHLKKSSRIDISASSVQQVWLHENVQTMALRM